MKIGFDPDHIGCGSAALVFIAVIVLASIAVCLRTGHFGVGIAICFIGYCLYHFCGKFVHRVTLSDSDSRDKGITEDGPMEDETLSEGDEMSEQDEYVKVVCTRCKGHIEAPKSMLGTFAECPHCGQNTYLRKFKIHTASINKHVDDVSVGGIVPVATIGLILMSIFVEVVLFLKSGSVEPELVQDYLNIGANLSRYTMGGQVWRLITSSFVHFGLLHLIFNMLCLWSFGSCLERLLGRRLLGATYFLTAIVASTVSCLMHSNELCGGASGAVFGLFGAYMSYLWFGGREGGVPFDVVLKNMKSGFSFLAINFLYSLKPGVDMSAHIGGLIAGLLIGYVIIVARKGGIKEGYVKNIAVAACCFIGMIMLASFFLADDAGRMTTKELTGVVSHLMEEKMTEALTKSGAKDVSISVRDMMLCRESAKSNRYLGNVYLTIGANGDVQDFNSVVAVTYDGEQYEYELKDADKLRIRLSDEELSSEVRKLMELKLKEQLVADGCKDVKVVVSSLKLTRKNGNEYGGMALIKTTVDGENEKLKATICVEYDGNEFSYQIKNVENL